MGEWTDAVRFYREAERLKEDPEIQYLGKIFRCTTEGSETGAFTLDDVTGAADAILSSPRTGPADLLRLGRTMVRGMSRDEEVADVLALAVLNRTNAMVGPVTQAHEVSPQEMKEHMISRL